MVKIKTICILALLAISANAQSVRFQNVMSAGLALAVGDGAEIMNPGLNICLEPVEKINQYFGLGGHIDYSWMSVDFPSGIDARAGTHFWDASFVPKLFVPITARSNFFCDIDPGFCLGLAYVRGGGYSDSDFEPGFSMTYQAGFDINQVVISFKMKSAFINGSSSSWANFNIGLKL